MNILAIESSSKQCSIAIHSNNSIHESSDIINNDSATSLPIMIEKMLSTLSLTFKDLDGIAISMGHVKSCLNLPRPLGKAKYFHVTDSELVP